MDGNREYRIRRAAMKDVEGINGLMQKVYDELEEKDLFVPDDKNYIARHVEKEGFILLAENSDDARQEDSFQSILCAFLIVRFPGNAKDNLGRYLHLSLKELSRVVHMESAVVHPDCRGQQLQQRLLMVAERELTTDIKEIVEKDYHLMCTVAPNNFYSMNTMIKMGYKVLITVPMYENKVRSVLCKQI